MEQTKSIMIVGVGGQGTLLTSRILGGITTQAGYDVKLSEEEGCLSLPDVRGSVSRFHEIKLHYQDLWGAQHVLQCRNLFARCIQHECDHLRGILFIDHLSKTERKDNQALLEDIKALGGQFDYAILEDD